MKNIPEMIDRFEVGNFGGTNKSHGRVTVQPDWYLNLSSELTSSGSIGKGPLSKKLPFRYFQLADDSQEEIEVPNVSSINIDRSLDADADTCKIVIYNTLLNADDDAGTLSDQFGEPGYYTFDYGVSAESKARWNREENDWANILVPNALLRTYEGYGGYDDDGSQHEIADCLTEGALTLTGIWLIDNLTYGTDGKITLNCRSTAKLLLDQILFPPLVPNNLYPIEECRWRYLNYNAKFNPRKPSTSGSVTEFYPTYLWSSVDAWYGDREFPFPLHGHRGTDMLDGDQGTYAMSVGNYNPASLYCTDYWEVSGGEINEVYIHTWGGNYTMYVSVMENGVWQTNGEGLIPYSDAELVGNNYDEFGDPNWVDTHANIPYVMKCGVPWEQGAWYQLPRVFNAERIRITFRDHMLTNLGPWLYRCGIRELKLQLNTLHTDPPALPWVFSIIPYRQGDGYWCVADDGQIFNFGDARKHNAVDTAAIDSTVVSMYPTPSGNGYWILQNDGRVIAFGDATSFENDTVYTNELSRTRQDGATNYIDLACTPSGDGLWLIKRDGTLVCLGAATDYGTISDTSLLRDPVESYVATGIESHPSTDGYWIVNGNGIVTAFGGLPDYGSIDPFRTNLKETEWVRGIVRNNDGNGYWILGGAGHVYNKGTTDFWGEVNNDPSEVFNDVADTSFRDLTWQMAPNQDGTGYWIVKADGTVMPFGSAYDYGSPGGVGTLRLPGSYLDYSDIVREVLLWSGFWFAKEEPPGDQVPEVYGNIEDTGIYNDACLPADMFDKKHPIEVIHAMRDIVGYIFRVDQEGAARFEPGNVWSIGNYLDDGTPFDYIPEIDESTNLFEYGVDYSAASARSEIIISTESPVDGNFTTSTTKYIPPTSDILRGMVNPSIWSNGAFSNLQEQNIMAELIGMQIWFQMRQGSATIPGFPCLELDDQVRIYERVTSESYIHYVRGISSSHNLDTGEYTFTLTTNWLGNEDDWVITSKSIPGSNRIRISDDLLHNMEKSPSGKLKNSWMNFEAMQDNLEPAFKSIDGATTPGGDIGAADGI